MSSYTPLLEPGKDVYGLAAPLEKAIDRARQVLDEKGRANIHDRDEMIRAACGLHYVLHNLLAALDVQRGEQR